MLAWSAFIRAAVGSYDIRDFTDASIIGGIDTAIRRGRSVINIEVRWPRLQRHARSGGAHRVWLRLAVVAAAGNEYDLGNPVEYPASLNHVLTIAGSNEADEPAYFSNANDAVDLAAPGRTSQLPTP